MNAPANCFRASALATPSIGARICWNTPSNASLKSLVRDAWNVDIVRSEEQKEGLILIGLDPVVRLLDPFVGEVSRVGEGDGGEGAANLPVIDQAMQFGGVLGGERAQGQALGGERGEV